MRSESTLVRCACLIAWCSSILWVTVDRVATAAPPTPMKVFAINHQNLSASGVPRDTILFFDVTDIDGGTNLFDTDGDGSADPLFSVWLGFEIFQGDGGGIGDLADPIGNDEDPGAITMNPANGTLYVAAFDSGSPSAGFPNVDPEKNPDPVGDSQGDWDLFRIDYQAILNDFVTNARPKGVVYGPTTQLITEADEQILSDDGSPLFDGVVDGVGHNVPHPESASAVLGDPEVGETIFIDNAIQKVGELARTQQSAAVGTALGGSFFDSEIEFVNPETLLFLDTATDDTQEGDFQLRAWQRVSREPGMATIDPNGLDDVPGNDDDQVGGRNASGATTESWEAAILGRLELDGDSLSEPTGMAFVRRDNVIGVWVSESDSGANGDDVAFYEIDFSGPTPTATKKNLAGSFDSFSAAENPVVDPLSDDGEVDFLAVDKDGNLVIGESGFFDTVTGSSDPPLGFNDETAEQPKVMIVGIDSYVGDEVLPTQDPDAEGVEGFDNPFAWTVTPNLEPTLSNDDDVLDSRRVAYDKGTGYIYFIDEDPDTDFSEDIYVFDPATGQIIYEELNPFNVGFFNSHTQLIITRGDITGDGQVTYDDISALSAALGDPTLGGEVSADVGQEWYDLTGDQVLTADDVDELIVGILGTARGDFNLDGMVDGSDLDVWESDFSESLTGGDFLDWQRNFGFNNMAIAAVPEPGSVALICCGFALCVLTACRGGSQDEK